MSKRIHALVAELGAELNVFFDGSDQAVAEIDTPSNKVLVILEKPNYDELLADALAWRSFAKKGNSHISAEEALRLFNSR